MLFKRKKRAPETELYSPPKYRSGSLPTPTRPDPGMTEKYYPLSGDASRMIPSDEPDFIADIAAAERRKLLGGKNRPTGPREERDDA